jgi:hypothetical protein
MNIEKLKNTIQACNLNFLVGSVLSVPYFSTLEIEVLITELETNNSPLSQLPGQCTLQNTRRITVVFINL